MPRRELAIPKPAIGRSALPKPEAWTRTAFYELKAVPVKGRVYRYWYLRYSDGGGVLRSLYLGKQAPEHLTPRQAVEALRFGADPVEPEDLRRFRERRSRLPKPRPGGK